MKLQFAKFNNSYAQLSEKFYSQTQATPVSNPKLIQFNVNLAEKLGLSEINEDGENVLEVFAGNKTPEGAEPIAMAYAGHQFGEFSPQLGDGRAILLGEVVSDNKRYDIQLKGSGRTPWSRNGDGRSALGPVLREYLVSEAMAKMGVPTTRALAAITTGEQVARNTFVAGGILTRVATGFVRVGTFQYFFAKDDHSAVKELADYEIKRHFTDAIDSDNPYVSFLKSVVDRQAKLIAKWMSLGFIHGVMNTDNMSIMGETIDYGPCAFMDEFDFNRVYSSIDQYGRYAYNKQPEIGQWNLLRFAETLLPLLSKDREEAVEIAQTILSNYQKQYQAYWLEGMNSKLGLTGADNTRAELANDLLSIMDKNKADFTLTFHYLSVLNDIPDEADHCIRQLFFDTEGFDQWLEKWRSAIKKNSLKQADRQILMKKVNPVYIPRNHLIEEAIRAAEDHNDFSVFYDLHDVLKQPFEVQVGRKRYSMPPKPNEIVHQTFCGT